MTNSTNIPCPACGQLYQTDLADVFCRAPYCRSSASRGGLAILAGETPENAAVRLYDAAEAELDRAPESPTQFETGRADCDLDR